MNTFRYKVGLRLSALLLAVSTLLSPALAGPIFTYNYTLQVKSSTPTTANGTLSFSLDVDPTTIPDTTNMAADITAFSATIAGNTFNVFNAGGGFNNVTDLGFIGGNLWNITYAGLLPGNIIIDLNGTSFGPYFEQLTGHIASGNIVFASSSVSGASPTSVPEPSTLSLMFGGLMLLAASFLLRHRKLTKTSL